jgi:hypothetical protein
VSNRKVSPGSSGEKQAEVIMGVLERLGADAATPAVARRLGGRERVIDRAVWQVLGAEAFCR